VSLGFITTLEAGLIHFEKFVENLFNLKSCVKLYYLYKSDKFIGTDLVIPIKYYNTLLGSYTFSIQTIYDGV